MFLSTRHFALATVAVVLGLSAVVQAGDPSPIPYTPAPGWMPPTVDEAKRDSWDSLQRARTQPITPRPLHYPNLDSPLYPCPRPNIPIEMGGTVITNSYMYPHEMLYHHHYRALYPPYYYKTKWKYGVKINMAQTANGMPVPTMYQTKVVHKVALKGTQVDVVYDNWSPFDFFLAPN